MSRNDRSWILTVLLLLSAIVFWAPADADAQTQVLAYSAKFVCGSRSSDSVVVSGVYATAVNIHNPHFIGVSFQKKAVIAMPQRAARGPISEQVPEQLGADRAIGMDCRDIRELFEGVVLPGLIEGFVVIYTPIELDVVAVHTARHRLPAGAAVPQDFDVETINTYEVTPKRVQLPIP